MQNTYVRTPEHRRLMSEKISVIRKKQWQDPEYRAKLLKALRSPERRRKLSEALKGRKTPWMVGREVSQETRRKLSEVNQRNWANPEFRKRESKRLSEKAKEQWKDSNFRNLHIKQLKHPLVADDDFSYIKGCIAGDGWFTYNRIVSLGTIDKEWALHFKMVLERWCSLSAKMILKEKKPPYHNQWWVILYSSEVVKFIKENEITYPIEYLKGFFDAEGTCYVKKGNVKVGVSNQDYELITKAKEILKTEGINAHLYKYHAHKNRWSQKSYYVLMLYSIKDVFWFYQNIGFRIARKQNRLKKWLEWINAHHTQQYLEKKVYG